MSRAAIVATIVTSMIALSPPSLAASDAEIVSLGDKMSGAFKCSTYAYSLHDQKKQQRLFQIGLKAGRDYVEGLKSRDDPSETAASASNHCVDGSPFWFFTISSYVGVYTRGTNRLCGRPDVEAAKPKLTSVIAKATAP